MKISIIIPVYKVENYLRKCLESVRNQTFRELEVVCVDDGSPDRCGEILDEYVADDVRFLAIRQQNAGLSAARNVGLDVATGDFVLFLDSDDWIEPTLCADALNVAVETGADATIFGGWLESEDGRTLQEENPRDWGTAATIDDVLERYRFGFRTFGPTVWKFLWKRAFLEKNRLRFREGIVCEDTPFLPVALKLAEKMAVCPKPSIHYLLRDRSIMRDYESIVYRGGAVDAFNLAWKALDAIPGTELEKRFIVQRKILFVTSTDCYAPFSKRSRRIFERSARTRLLKDETVEVERNCFEYWEGPSPSREKTRELYRILSGNRGVRWFYRTKRALRENSTNRKFRDWIRRLKNFVKNVKKSPKKPSQE